MRVPILFIGHGVVALSAAFVIAALALRPAEPSPVTWDEPIEVAAGNAHRGPWRMNRSDFDYVDVLDPSDDLRLLGQYPIDADGAAGTNPHDIAFAPDGRAFVALYGAPEIAALARIRPGTTIKLD